MFRVLLALVLLQWPLASLAQSLPDAPPVLGENIDPATLTDTELLDLLRRIEAQRVRPGRVAIFGIPSGFGAPNGYWFAAAAATNRRDRGRLGAWDASLAVGVGFGNAATGIGITPIIDITSVSPHHIGESGKIGVRFSRALPSQGAWQMSAAVDAHNILTWGDSNVLQNEVSLAVSAIKPANRPGQMPMMWTIGYGSGVSDIGTEPGFFAGLGVGVRRNLGFSLGWYGDEAIAGASLWPDRDKNLLISVGVGDITNAVSGRRIILAVSFARPTGWN